MLLYGARYVFTEPNSTADAERSTNVLLVTALSCDALQKCTPVAPRLRKTHPSNRISREPRTSTAAGVGRQDVAGSQSLWATAWSEKFQKFFNQCRA